MGHSMPNMSIGRGGFLQQKPNMKWKKNDGRRKQGLFSAQEKANEPPRFRNLQFQNCSKTKKCFIKRKHRPPPPPPPQAPLNTTSYIIRSKYLGGIAPLVTPSPVTPAVLATPSLSPFPRYREDVGDAVNEWGVNGYGSMNGLIRVRAHMKDEPETEIDFNRCVHAQSLQQLEQRLDQDLSRFEMVFPSFVSVSKEPLLEVRIDDQENHIAQLEEENNTLKERLSSMEQELEDLRRRMHLLEGLSASCEQGEVCSEKSIGNA